MEDLEKYIKERLEELEETYDFYLEKLDNTFDFLEIQQYENRLRDLRIERNTLKDVLKQIEGEE